MSRLPSEEEAVAHEIYERLGGFIPGCVVTMEAATEAARAVLALLNERAAASPTPGAAPTAVCVCRSVPQLLANPSCPVHGCAPEAAPVVSGSVCGTCGGSGQHCGSPYCISPCADCGGTGKAGGR